MRGIDNTERQQQQNEQGTSVVLQNPEVFQNDGFVDMNRTQFVWARAFPSCYRPSYINMNGTMKWIIMNDITGFDSKHPREKIVQFKDWIQHQLWRSDGFPAKHPTWSICMLNHKMKNALQKQGTYAISTNQLDPSVTIRKIQEAAPGRNLTRMVQQVMKIARLFASNVPGTDPYWHSTRFKMKAINFYQRYIEDNQLSVFHTGSLAEYHELALRK